MKSIISVRRFRGIDSYVASGSEPNVLTKIFNGDNVGTYFVPKNAMVICINTGSKRISRRKEKAIVKVIEQCLES